MAGWAAAAAAIIGAVSNRNSSREASESQREGQSEALAASDAGYERGRSDAIPLYQAAQTNALRGYQGAMDLYGGAIPQQMQAAQQGNMAAQQSLLSGLQQQQSALLGGNVDLSQLQASQVSAPDPGFFNVSMPQFESIEGSVAPTSVAMNPWLRDMEVPPFNPDGTYNPDFNYNGTAYEGLVTNTSPMDLYGWGSQAGSGQDPYAALAAGYGGQNPYEHIPTGYSGGNEQVTSGQNQPAASAPNYGGQNPYAHIGAGYASNNGFNLGNINYGGLGQNPPAHNENNGGG